MRLFVAIPVADDVRAALTAMQSRLRASGADVKWVEPENFHLTVKFLGDLEDSLLDDLKSVCEELAAGTAPFRISVGGASSFPVNRPQVKTILARVEGDGARAWAELVRRSEPGFAPFDVPREGGLKPHVTLGRVRSEKNIEALRAAVAAEAKTACGEQDADRIVLVQSTLDPRGATYTERSAWPLTGI
jgi:2'-5' RNA ligase